MRQTKVILRPYEGEVGDYPMFKDFNWDAEIPAYVEGDTAWLSTKALMENGVPEGTFHGSVCMWGKWDEVMPS